MAKRFTDTDKWKKPLLKSIPCQYKLLWLYICDDCDHAGIWNVDIEVASIRIGEQISEQKAIEIFGEKIFVFDGGEKWFIQSFIDFQYGELNEKNRVHESIIKILKKYNLFNIKPLTSPLQGAKDKDKDKEQDIDMDKDKENTENEKLLIPKMFSIFKKHLPQYPGSKEKDFKHLLSIANFILEQSGNTGPPIKFVNEITEAWEPICLVIKNDNFYAQKSLSTISNHIQEILQNSLHGKKQPISTRSAANNAISRTIERGKQRLADEQQRRSGSL
jgi:hypothetical protein